MRGVNSQRRDAFAVGKKVVGGIEPLEVLPPFAAPLSAVILEKKSEQLTPFELCMIDAGDKSVANPQNLCVVLPPLRLALRFLLCLDGVDHARGIEPQCLRWT